MTLTRLFVSALLVGATGAALSCADPTSTGVDSPLYVTGNPWMHGGNNGGGGGGQNGGLLRCSALGYDSVTQTIGPQGGKIAVGPHELWIGPGALPVPVSITAVMPSDTVNLVRLRPEGLVFEKPVALTMSYVNCDTGSSTAPKRIAFTDNSLNIVEYEPSVDHGPKKKVTGALSHFSQYAVSW